MPELAESRDPTTFRTVLRPARVEDIPELIGLETVCFQTDRLTRRNFQYLLTRAHAVAMVETEQDQVIGYALVLLNGATALARLYSLAVLPALRGRGIAQRLLNSVEQSALERGSARLRLEVRRDNPAALALYKKSGYRKFGVYADYYQDHMEALRLEKRLVPAAGPPPRPSLRPVPYYAQTFDFTSGPAALMMALKALRPPIELSRKLELRIWRESTTVFTYPSQAGCGPHGLALAAWHRGLSAEVYVSDDRPWSLGRTENNEVAALIDQDFRTEIAATGITLDHHCPNAADLAGAVTTGALAIVLIHSYRHDRTRAPHWVVVTGADDRFLYLHDPRPGVPRTDPDFEPTNMPIARKDFAHMARYGKSRLQASVIVRARQVD